MKEDFRGVILKGVGGLYGVRPDRMECEEDSDDMLLCSARGLFRHENVTPLPGDAVWVRLGTGKEDGVIWEILPRTNSLIRCQSDPSFCNNPRSTSQTGSADGGQTD